MDQYEGSESAKERVHAIMSTLTGEMTVAEACERLNLSVQRFFQLRDAALQAAVSGLESSWRGRPPKPEPTAAEKEVKVLREHLQEMELAVEAAHIRAQVAIAMPKVLKLPPSDSDPLNPEVMAERLKKKLQEAHQPGSGRRHGKKGRRNA
jgi:hypothetical protein